MKSYLGPEGTVPMSFCICPKLIVIDVLALLILIPRAEKSHRKLKRGNAQNETSKYCMTATIYHNPKCSKSRQTLALLEEKGIKLEVIKYLQTPPDFITLDNLLTKLNMEPRQLMRRKETLYNELQLETATLGRAALIQAMIDNPILIERPIVVANDQVRLGRPPESVLEIFD